MENLRKIAGRGYLYTLGRWKSNQEGRLERRRWTRGSR
jgi:hypothetical protein